MSRCWPGERVGLIFFFFFSLLLVLVLVFVLVLLFVLILDILVLLLYPVLRWPCVVDRTLRSNYYYYYSSVSCPSSTLWRLTVSERVMLSSLVFSRSTAELWHGPHQDLEREHVTFCIHVHTGGVSFWVQFNVTLRPQRPQGLLGTESPGRPPRLSHSSSALTEV